MKLYCHPASSTSRPVMLFIAESGITVEQQVVDLFTGEHFQPAFEAINANHQVPVLDDGAFRLTESSAILKYLADKIDSPLYPHNLQQRARVNERMDWLNTQLSRDYCYGFVYPQIFPNQKRPNEAAQGATLEWGRERAKGWLKVLDESILGTSPYLCGESLTIADFLGASFVAVGELTGSDLSVYPNVTRWLGRMKALPNWAAVNAAIDGYGASLKATPMTRL